MTEAAGIGPGVTIDLGAAFSSVFAAFAATARAHPGNAYLAVPPREGRDYDAAGSELTYGTALREILTLSEHYYRAGYGPGHRVALMLDNRPDHFLHLIALNRLGVSVVPVNPDYLHDEIAYLCTHAEVSLAIVLAHHFGRIAKVAASCGGSFVFAVAGESPPAPRRPAPGGGAPGRTSEAAILYTSGTTGRPKGCVLDNEYFLASGAWYAAIGGRIALSHGQERVQHPLPLFHMNAGIITPMAMLLTANCMILPDRFHARTWWADLIATRATAFHYLGIVPPVLMKQPACAEERQHAARWGLGAGIDPAIHAAFETRFGVAMCEVWGMTETGRILCDAHEPRQITTRAFGRPFGGFEARVVDDRERDVAPGQPGELIVRMTGENPRAGFFRGYLKDEAATEEAWRCGWFHSGDVVCQAADGMLSFVERKKNIIRRSGENISAAEVENALIDHPAISRVAVLAAPDELREEEVMACVVLSGGHAPIEATAREIAASVHGRLALYKVPGWIVFLDELPTTGTQKVQKGLIFAKGEDPRQHPRAFDLRPFKARKP